MAVRPAWTIKNGTIFNQSFSFEWNPGFAVSQKKKNIANLHAAINGKTLEISTKSDEQLGRKLSAFNLKLDGYTLECVFQSSKYFKMGGPYTDLLYVTPVEAKKDQRKMMSGELMGFEYGGIKWPLNPKTAFYDYIYVKAAAQTLTHEELQKLLDYDYFTDIEFNPNKSVNCQARAVAILKQLLIMGVDITKITPKDWIDFHQLRVKV